MDPNRVRNTDYINAYGFGDDGGTLLSDFNDWDLHEQYNHPFDLTPSNAFDRLTPTHLVCMHMWFRIPEVRSPFGAVASMPDPSVEDTDFS
ncbi:hypothetical protein HN51_010980 [Arachis hypogaea]